MRRFLIAGLLTLSSSVSLATAQTLNWQPSTSGGLVATDEDYHYSVRTTLGSIAGTMFTVQQMTKDSPGEGLSAFCREYTNLGRMGDTLIVQINEWNVFMSSSDFKRRQVADALKKNTPSDISFALSYACLEPDAARKGDKMTLYIPNGATFMLPYPTGDLKMKFTATPDGRITTSIVR